MSKIEYTLFPEPTLDSGLRHAALLGELFPEPATPIAPADEGALQRAKLALATFRNDAKSPRSIERITGLALVMTRAQSAGDRDHARSPTEFEEIAARYEASFDRLAEAGVEFVAYTGHSHGGLTLRWGRRIPYELELNVILPLARPIEGVPFSPDVIHVAKRHVIERFGLPDCLVRAPWRAIRPPRGSQWKPIYRVHAGEPLDLLAVIEREATARRETERQTALAQLDAEAAELQARREALLKGEAPQPAPTKKKKRGKEGERLFFPSSAAPDVFPGKEG